MCEKVESKNLKCVRTKLRAILIVTAIGIVVFIIYKCSQAKGQETVGNVNECLIYSGLASFYPQSNFHGQIVTHKMFVLQYNEQAEQAEWVVYLLTSKMVKQKIVKRSDKFKPDPLVETKSATPSDYKWSGYDKGHLCPAADMEWDKTASQETFYMSNMSPQVPQFNRGIWKELEEKVRYWAKINDSIIVITGPILKNYTKTIGKDKVAVPKAYFKIIADISYPTYKTIAFIIPNAESEKSIFVYAVPVDSVEKIENFNVFEKFPELESTEGTFDSLDWK